MTQTLLSAQNITRRFGGLTAIDNVSLELKRGAVHAVIGTNGAGKSTLVSVLSGELAPNEGTIFMNDGNITARSEEHTSELQSLMRISYAVFCLKKKKTIKR